MVEVSCYVEMSRLIGYIKNEKRKCEVLLQETIWNTEASCPPEFKHHSCWPPTKSLDVAVIACPHFSYTSGNISRQCSADHADINLKNQTINVFSWNNTFEDCFQGGKVNDISNMRYLEWWNEKFKILDQIGYASSTVCLMLALLIFFKFRHLRDTRVKLHINLFLAMLMESILSIVHTLFYGCKILVTMMEDDYSQEYYASTVCRCIMTFSHYFRIATYIWLMIECWYFYNYISRAPYYEVTSLKRLLLFGWGMPVVVVIPWVLVQIHSSNSNFCWVDADEIINITAIPILVIVIINLCFSVLNVRMIFIKMKASCMSKRRMRYWKWIKSTLMVMPLFGSYDILCSIWPWVENPRAKIFLLLLVRFICAIEGVVVTTLYCFANSHVRSEIQRFWKNWRQKKEIDANKLKHRRPSMESISRLRYDIETDSCKGKFKQLDFASPYF